VVIAIDRHGHSVVELSPTIALLGDRRIVRLQGYPWRMPGRKKQVFTVTYPNGKTYVGMDLTGSVSYFGCPGAQECLEADLAEHRLDLTARKHIVWESDTATDAEVRAVGVALIDERQANDPAIGCNLMPKPLPLAPDVGAPPMRYYARPEGVSQQLRVPPRPACWEKVDHPDQILMRAYLDDTEALLADSRVDSPWALRLDVGISDGPDLLDTGNLDNYAYPLAYHLRNPDLVSVWCTKQHSEQSFVRIEPARDMRPPSTDLLVAPLTAPASTPAYKEQLHAIVAGETELPAGPVRLELAFVVRPGRNWLNLFEQTIDSLDPLLGRTHPDRDWNPLDGRITELGMHKTEDPAVGNNVVISMAASPA
jgi:hypothetical protein